MEQVRGLFLGKNVHQHIIKNRTIFGYPSVPRGSEVLPKCKINERCRKDKADGSEKERDGLSFKARLML